MGRSIDRDRFDEADYERFGERLERSLVALQMLLARDGFGVGAPSLGAELELCLVDAHGAPLPLNRTVLAEAADPRIALEIDRFNLEINACPVALAGAPFAALREDLSSALAAIARAAAPHGGRVVTIGVLPTLLQRDLQSPALTDLPRYRALSAGLARLRQAPYQIVIEGEDRIALFCDDVTLEGANTSFQVHLRVDPKSFARAYNAAQIATAPILAVSGNSPLFLGRRLWDETRIALFRQSVDDRYPSTEDDWRPARVSFGHGWVRQGAYELFAESVALHPPLLPVVGPEDPLDVAHAGGIPALSELRLHQGTVWRWNRAVYDDADGGHLRVEMRALPAGPTPEDMSASAAFLVGLVLALTPVAERLVERMTFGHARRNFYEAAKKGLDAELLWPSERSPSPRLISVRKLVPTLLPLARQGLLGAGVLAEDADRALSVVARRVERGQTGAIWQRESLARLRASGAEQGALRLLLERYLTASETGRPVHEWSIAS